MRLTPVCRELPFSRALSLPGGHWGSDRRPGDTPHALPLRPSWLCSAGLLKKLVEIFQQTSLGRFLAQLSTEQQEELFLCYIKDFLLLTMRVSTWEELRVSAHSGAGEGAALSLHPQPPVRGPLHHGLSIHARKTSSVPVIPFCFLFTLLYYFFNTFFSGHLWGSVS